MLWGSPHVVPCEFLPPAGGGTPLSYTQRRSRGFTHHNLAFPCNLHGYWGSRWDVVCLFQVSLASFVVLIVKLHWTGRYGSTVQRGPGNCSHNLKLHEFHCWFSVQLVWIWCTFLSCLLRQLCWSQSPWARGGRIQYYGDSWSLSPTPHQFLNWEGEIRIKPPVHGLCLFFFSAHFTNMCKVLQELYSFSRMNWNLFWFVCQQQNCPVISNCRIFISRDRVRSGGRLVWLSHPRLSLLHWQLKKISFDL